MEDLMRAIFVAKLQRNKTTATQILFVLFSAQFMFQLYSFILVLYWTRNWSPHAANLLLVVVVVRGHRSLTNPKAPSIRIRS